MRANFKVIALACCSALFGVNGAAALSVAPLVLELSSGSANRSAQFLVENDSASSKPVEVAVYEVEVAENGEQRRRPASSDFLIFPATRLLAPHSRQLFKVQWVGNPLPKSKTFIFALNELPVKMPEQKSGVQVIFNFDIIANVAPPSGTHTLDVVSSGLVNQNGHRYPSLLLSNTGNAHAKLSDAVVTFRVGAWSRTLTPGELQSLLGAALVQPGRRRNFVIPVDVPAQASAFTVEISYPKNLK
jgi:P pilus assembly chaperone PapD